MPYRNPPIGNYVCARCGNEFRRRSDKGCVPKFCSKTCAGKANAARPGQENPRYNGGLCFHGGRWIIHCRDGSLLAYYRGVMAAKLGRLLHPEEIVHHINGDSSDDRIENLYLTDRSEHMKMHRADLNRGRGLV